MSANSSSLPAIPSAKAMQASLPETIIIPLSKFSTVISSLCIMYIEETSLPASRHAFSDTKNLSSKLNSPFLINSKATIEVIILVIDAGNIERLGFFS